MSAQQFQNTSFVSETTHFYQLKFGEKNYYESDFILQKTNLCSFLWTSLY